jgi:hypothetical protein
MASTILPRISFRGVGTFSGRVRKNPRSYLIGHFPERQQTDHGYVGSHGAMMNEPPADAACQTYPRGEDDSSYVIVFQIWAVLFLGIICVGLLNFIAMWWRGRG